MAALSAAAPLPALAKVKVVPELYGAAAGAALKRASMVPLPPGTKRYILGGRAKLFGAKLTASTFSESVGMDLALHAARGSAIKSRMAPVLMLTAGLTMLGIWKGLGMLQVRAPGRGGGCEPTTTPPAHPLSLPPLLLQAFTKNFDEKLKQDEIDLYGEYISPDATALDPAEADESEGGDEGGDAGGDDTPPAPPVDDTPDIL